ncbi:four helix bundle protein [Paracnuella aquatica]|uniref:four helix bundle protein n=1 Tax=Paracnuella aquatica TaxID=2268757 RepID=UPI000DEEA849|nr:four helix bundle protein [Paracnuella aquatica]RPD51568.1 four helix bundle protein [Paracnuella aquatica]
MGDLKNLIVYQKAFQLALDIHQVSQAFLPDEKFSLTSQIRRSSRSVCANLAEAYRRRKYRQHFLSKLADCESENTETAVWLDFAFAFKYFNDAVFKDFSDRNVEVGKMIWFMIQNPDRFC